MKTQFDSLDNRRSIPPIINVSAKSDEADESLGITIRGEINLENRMPVSEVKRRNTTVYVKSDNLHRTFSGACGR